MRSPARKKPDHPGVPNAEPDPCQLVWQVNEFASFTKVVRKPDPCQLVWQVNEFASFEAVKLLHLPDEPAGVEKEFSPVAKQ